CCYINQKIEAGNKVFIHRVKIKNESTKNGNLNLSCQLKMDCIGILEQNNNRLWLRRNFGLLNLFISPRY
ncbi:MAG: hypothetical protein ACR2KZ_02260, partial [Segetibacter sp.]